MATDFDGIIFDDEQQNDVEDFGGIVFDDEPSAPSLDVQPEPEQPAAEPAPKPRGFTMSSDEMNVPAASLLTKEEAKDMGEMGANEVAARSYEQATGADAPKSGFLAQLANMGLAVGGRLNANLQMSAAQQLASDEERKDLDTSKLFSQMTFGLGKYNFFRPASALDEWDDSDGLSYKTPEERTAARNAFARELARQFIAERTATKQNAAMELENREQGHVATIFGKGPAQVGYSLPYMLGPLGIGLQFAEESAANATELASDEYGFAADGSLGVTAQGDSMGKAVLKGATSAGIETATEIVGGKIGGAIIKRGGKAVIGRLPIAKVVNGKVMETPVGAAAKKFGAGLKNVFSWTSKKLHLENPLEENLEEFESDIANAIFGTDKRDSELVDAKTGKPSTWYERGGKAVADFVKPQNILELNEAMALTMGGGAFVGWMAQRGARKQVDSFLRDNKLMTEEEIASADLQTKAQAIDAWSKGLSEDEIVSKIEKATGWVDKLADKISGEKDDSAEKVVTATKLMNENRDYAALRDTALRNIATLRDSGATPQGFTVQTDDSGAPKFSKSLIVNPVSGEQSEQNVMTDAAVGVTVVDTDGTYDVTSAITGDTFRTRNLNRAIEVADMFAYGNQQRVMERQQKAQALSGILGGEQYAGRKIEVVETEQQARDNFGGDIENDAPGFTTDDGTTVLILDNLDDPKTALAALDKGTPNDRGAFADGAKFETEAAPDENGEMVETRVARDKVHNVNIIDGGDGKFVVFGDGIPYTNANSIDNAIAIARGEKPSETRADEKPAQPEQGEVVAPAEPETAEPVEGAETPAEAPDAGVVEPETPAPAAEVAQKPVEAAAEPKVDKDTPAPTEGAEVASRASEASQDLLGDVPSPEIASVTDAKRIKKQLEKKRRKGGVLTDEQNALLAKADEMIAADVKAKRDASRAATLEKAEAITPPSWFGKNAGPAATRVSELAGYLANKEHNRASLHRAIQSVRDYIRKHGPLALSKGDKATLAEALAKAKSRLDKMVENDRAAFAERNADLPASQLEKYLSDRPNPVLDYWYKHNGVLFERPRSAAAAKKAAGGKGALRDAKFDGKLFDPDAVGADELNHFFDGMSDTERNRWLRLLFGKDTKEVTVPTVTGNDAVLEELGLSMGEVLSTFRDKFYDFQEWRENGAESAEETYYRDQYEEEQRVLDEEFGPVAEYALDELEARGMRDLEYANAKAFVYNRADGNDFSMVTPSALAKAEEGDVIQFDHLPQFFSVLSYDAKNGILTVLDATGENPVGRAFRVTENDISEIKLERQNDKPAETRSTDARSDDARGAQARGGAEGAADAEVARAGAAEGRTDRTGDRAAGTPYETIARAIDPAWQSAHADEVQRIIDAGVPISAVASNPNVKGTDKVSWPVTATQVNSREDAANIFSLLANPDYEITKVLYLDRDGNILERRVTHVGYIAESEIVPYEIFSRMPDGTYGVIVSHNHPSQQGNEVRASKADIAATSSLRMKASKKGVLLLDHIITDHNAYESLGTRDKSLVSVGAQEFWDNADTRFAFEGPATEKPEDTMNLVPFDKRITPKNNAVGILNRLAAILSKSHDKSSWVAGIDDSARIATIVAFPRGGDMGEFVASLHGSRRYAVLNGENALDMPAFVKAIESRWSGASAETRPAIIAVGENGKLTEFAEEGLNDKYRGTSAAQTAAPAEPAAPRLANAPKLNDKASKAIDDILGEMGGILGTNGEQIFSPVEPLDGESSRVLAEFEDPSKYIETYRSALFGDDGKIYPPMATRGAEGMELGKVYRSEERPELRNDKGKFPLRSDMRDSGRKGEVRAAYAPYFHSSPSVINDQFSAAYDKSRMVTVKSRVLRSDLDEHYQAEGSPRKTGLVEWERTGPVARQIRNGAGREVYLSRYIMPVQVLSDAETARLYKQELGGADVTVPWNVVTPSLARELRKIGVKVGENDGVLHSDAEPLSLSREEERKFRDAVERMVETLADNGFNTFDDLARVVASRRPDIYGRAQDLLRRSWNFIARDPADEITVARGKEIFGKIDSELQPKETTNDLEGNAGPADQPVGAQTDAAARDTTERGASVPAGAGVGGAGRGTRGPVGGERPAAPVRDGAGAVSPDVREDGRLGEGSGGRTGGSGDSVGERSVGLRERDGEDGAQERSAGRAVHDIEEVTPGFAAYEPPADLPVKAPKSQSLIVESMALASVTPPKIEAKPDIPDSIPESGVLQAHQYQAVCQAVNAHNKVLPDGRRMGYFCGDGTGVGKTRVIAGVMLDAVNRKLGKGRALIVSKNNELFNSALDDFEPFHIADRLFQLNKKGRARLAAGDKGIAFTTYSSFAKEYGGTDTEEKVRSLGKGQCRYAQLVKWLGKDFDGVIAFDEAHSAAKGDEAVEGDKQASWTQTVLDVQKALPNARILYLTATSAYDAEDLKFLQRMGLWGDGAGFRRQSDFARAVNDGGLSMMELLTQSMKARGVYCSRSISFKGVTCRREVAALTPEQKAVYNQYVDVIRQIHDAALSLPGFTNDKPAQVAKQYFGRALDLFNSLMTAMKVQKAIEIGRQAIADGKSPIFQLISTNDAAKKAKEGKKKKPSEINLFSTPEGVAAANAPEVEVGVKDRILSYLNGDGFPIRFNTGEKDSKGDTIRGDVVPGAAAIRDAMVELVNTLPDVGNPIDEIVKAFQDVGISRISGGSNKTAEADAFNSGKNLALVFSGAGGTGASYHADRRFKNQRQRVQIPIEFGWEPDKFIQALGRSHRNNQVVPPEFVLLTTDIAGEMRFMSTIANRVASMGAIVGGDRNSSGQVVSASDSMDNKYGRTAIRETMHRLSAGLIRVDLGGENPYDLMFLDARPDKLDKVPPTKFLGRIQMLPVDAQNAIYADIADGAARAIEKAKADGTYDDGIRKIDAKRVVVKNREAIAKGASPVDMLTVGEWYDSPRINHEELEARAPQGRTVEYVRNKKSGRLYGIFQNGDRLVRLAPDGAYTTLMPFERENYDKVATESARGEWDAEYEKVPAEVERVNRYVSGDLIPMWDKIGVEGRPYVYRAQPQDADPFIGLYISDTQTPVTLYGFGKKDEARKYFDENAYRLVREGSKFGIGAAASEDVQPYFKRAKVGTRYVLAAFHVPEGSALERDFADGWDRTWMKDETSAFDRGGDVYYRDFGEDAESAFNEIVKKRGVVIYRNGKPAFESRDGLVPEAAPVDAPVRNASRAMPEQPARGQTSLGERIGMPEMRMRLQNGNLIITNTRPVRALLNNMKLAFGGKWANRVRDGKRYVQSDLRWNKTPSGNWWSIPLEKVPADILSEIEGEGLLNAPIAPLTSVEELDATGGLARLAQNPEELKTTFVYNLLRSDIEPLFEPKNKAYSEKELLRRAIDESDMTALGELYNRYMGPNAAKGGLPGLIRRAAARKGMDRVMNESRIEEVASLVWAGTKNGSYEQNRRGIIADFNAGDTEIYKKAGSLIPVMTTKVDRILNDMAERAANRPEMQTLDAPSTVREGESELDQQIADDASAAEGLLGSDAQNEYIEETPETILANKLVDAGEAAGRRLTPAERNRLAAMDTLDELTYFLPEEYQEVINAVLAAERERGFTNQNSRVDALGREVLQSSYEEAQRKTGLSRRVFNARLYDARRMLNTIAANMKRGDYDANIAIKASEVVGAQETDEELNESILDNLRDNAATSDMALAVQLLLRGESVEDVAYGFDVSPNTVRAWKARARNEHLITFPGDEVENTLGLENFPERKAVKRGPRSARGASASRPSTWSPDLFAFANTAVNDTAEDKIAEGIAASATDEQIAREANVAPEIVRIERIRQSTTTEGPVVTPKPVRTTRGMRTEQVWNPETGHFEERTEYVMTDGSTEPVQGLLLSPVEPLEQGTLGIETPTAEEIFGYTNAAMNEWRSEHGFNELAKGAKVSLDALHRQGAAIANNIDEMKRMVERLEKAPYAVNAVDQVALGQFVARMEGEYNDLARLKAEQHANGNEAMAIQTDIEMDELFKWIDRAQRVNKKAGAEWGRTGRARQLAIDKAGNLADYMISCAERKGSPLTKSEKAQAELLFKTFSDAQKKYDNLTMDDIIAQLDALSKIRLARQQDGIKERRGKFTPEQIERDYAEALAQIRYHGEHRSGGTLHGLPNGQKWIRAIEAYHLMNGEGLTDGKPDGAKMAQLVLDDILAQGVDATLWDVRQMESRMGNLVKPSQDEMSKSLRDLHAQMLVEQQIEHIVTTGELPPKTGIDRDEDSAAARALRRIRDRMIREKGISRKSDEEQLKSALDSYKRRLENQIEENEKALADIEAGLPYEPKEKVKLQLDAEAQALKDRNAELKKRIAELTRDPAKEHDKRVIRAMDVLAKRIAVRKEQLANAQAQGTAYDFDGQRPQKLEDSRLDPMRAELDRLNQEFKALKKALYPDGTDAEIARKLEQRLAARRKQLDRWNRMAAEYTAADTWEERWNAVAPAAKRPPLESEATLKAAKERNAARRKVVEYRERLKREDTRGENVKAWARFLGSTSVLARAMLDMSVVGIQGGKFLRSHPIKATKIAGKATKAFFRQSASDALAKEIANHPYFEDFRKNGGHIYAMEGIEGDVPEDFRAVADGAPLPGGRTLTAENIPGVKRSNRSFAGFLNKAALELYADMVEAAGENGTGATDAQKKLIADFVNISLGYGYGKKNPGAKTGLITGVLDAIAWAPRKAVAELKHATLAPFATSWLGTRRHEISGREVWNVEKQIGREYLRYTLGSLAFGACLLLLAKLINGDDDPDRNRWSDMTDPRSTDFGRVRVGNTTWSVFAGNEMVWRLLARLFTQQKKTNGIVKDAGFTDTVTQYLRGKINPIGGIVWDVAEGENYVGKKLSEKSGWDVARGYLLPLTANALYENFAKNPDDPLAAIFNAVPTFYGMTSATYERDSLERVVAQGDEAKRRIKASAEAGDVDAAQRAGEGLRERGEVYGAAKGVSKMETKLKNLEAQAKTLKYTIDRSKDGGSPQLQKNYADVTKAIDELKERIAAERKGAMSVYRENRDNGMRWDDMGWAD